MNIGILTFHSARNYGAILQCYALQRYLTDKGHRVCVIDYSNETILKPYPIFSLRRVLCKNPLTAIKRLYTELRFFKARLNRERGFKQFITNEIKLERVSQIENSQFDLIIIGSDQVWNFKLTGGFDPFYWGAFKKNQGTIVASYAASMMDSWEEKYSKAISTYLENFDYISVREKIIADKLSILCRKKVSVVVDPTLLLSKKQWGELTNDNTLADTPYLLLYQVEESDLNVRIAKQIAKDLHLHMKVLSAREDATNSKGIREADPYYFISLFKYARFIVASSFHGTVFSLIFNKPFVSIRTGKNNEARVETLLNYFNLKHLFISKYDSEKLNEYIKCHDVNIDRMSCFSKEYLQILTEYRKND